MNRKRETRAPWRDEKDTQRRVHRCPSKFEKNTLRRRAVTERVVRVKMMCALRVKRWKASFARCYRAEREPTTRLT